MQSQLLTEFYNGIQEWIDQGYPEHDTPYRRGVGICRNLDYFAGSRGLDISEKDAFFLELRAQFKAAKLDTVTPFNNDDTLPLYEEEKNKYTNPLRLKWIKEHAQS